MDQKRLEEFAGSGPIPPAAPMIRYCGRNFTSGEIAQIRRLIEEDPTRSRAQLSRLPCRMFAWYKPDGGLKGDELPGGHVAHA